MSVVVRQGGGRVERVNSTVVGLGRRVRRRGLVVSILVFFEFRFFEDRKEIDSLVV